MHGDKLKTLVYVRSAFRRNVLNVRKSSVALRTAYDSGIEFFCVAFHINLPIL